MKIQMHINAKVANFLDTNLAAGEVVCAIQGGRRAGKTYNIAQWLLLKALAGDIVLCASMTNNQARNGVYADFKAIITALGLEHYCDVLSSPREIRIIGSTGKIIFQSFADSETAKGVACDYCFINEANKFTYPQYVDITCNVRKMTILDYNPNVKFWVEEIKLSLLVMTWRDNPYLTPAQLKWFADLRERATRINATKTDVYYYRVYYLGEYAEQEDGEMFRRDLLQIGEAPEALYHYAIFCDPSALRGSDYFACYLSAVANDGKVWIIDAYSPNTGSRADIVRQLLIWGREYDVAEIFIETNGIIGQDFLEYAQNSKLPNVLSWYSTGNKYERIVANCQNICENLYFSEKVNNLQTIIERVCTFAKKCKHDDDIDAISSSYTMQKYRAVQYGIVE